jgi:hypothetical protein
VNLFGKILVGTGLSIGGLLTGYTLADRKRAKRQLKEGAARLKGLFRRGEDEDANEARNAKRRKARRQAKKLAAQKKAKQLRARQQARQLVARNRQLPAKVPATRARTRANAAATSA